jgi:hypothetical protein
MSSDDSIVTGIIVTSVIAFISLLFFIATFLFRRDRPLTVKGRTLRAVSATLFGMSLVIIISLGAGLSGGAGAVLRVFYTILVVATLFFYSWSIVVAMDGHVPEIFEDYWDMYKVFSGGMFGDFANTVGILSGVGAYQLKEANNGWFWLAQFAAILAALVGLSHGMRWILEAGDKLESGQPKYTRWYALLNFAVGIFTFLAVATPTAMTSQDMLELLRHLLLKILQWIVLVLMLVNILIYFFKYWGIWGKTGRKLGFSLWLFMFLLAGGAIIALAIFGGTIAPNWLAAVFGGFAIFSWLAIEVMSAVQNRRENIKLLRSILIILGNFFMFILLLLVSPQPEEFTPVHWMVFSFALTFLIGATLLGLILSAYSTAKKAARRRRYAWGENSNFSEWSVRPLLESAHSSDSEEQGGAIELTTFSGNVDDQEGP